MKTIPSSQRGSVLLVALIFAAIIAIALSSYLKMAKTALTVSQRSFLSNDSMNIAEAGLERALWSFNQANVSNAAAWTGWTQITGTDDMRRQFTTFTLSQNATAVVNVYLKNYNSTGIPAPIGVAKSRITPANSPAIEKWVEIYLTRRSFFGTGLVGKRGITFNGNNTQVDSWISGVDTNPTSPTAYSTGVRRPYGSVAALSVDADVSVGNSNIYGYVSVGSEDSGGHVSLGPNGVVSGDFNAPEGTRDDERIAGNFTADLPDVTVPAPAIVNTVGHGDILDGSNALPAGGDKINPTDQTYYYTIKGIDLDDSDSHGNKKPALAIRSNFKVVILIDGGSGTETVHTNSTSMITINTGGSLAIYTAGNVNLAGLGVANLNGATTAFQIWGTNTTAGAQTIKVAGNAGLSGIVYAPNAGVTITGNGDVKGSVVGDTITLNGNGNFHYDESLSNFGGNNPFRVAKWRELVSATQRSLYATELDF